VDAQSVEFGIGPICREKHGFNVDVDDESRTVANKIVHQVAATQELTPEQATQLEELGFSTLATKLAARLLEAGAVTVKIAGKGFDVSTPFCPEATSDWRALPGRRWFGTDKVNWVPASQKNALWALLKKHFAGARLTHPAGTCFIAG
jgi:hypothetical protein